MSSFSTRFGPSLLLALLLAPAGAAAQVPDEAATRLRALYAEGAFQSRSFQASWLPDGSGYARLENADGGDGPELVAYDAASGTRTVLASRTALTPAGGSRGLDVEAWALSPEAEVALLRVDPGRADAGGAELWTLERATGLLRKVAEGVDGGALDGALSPDGGRILFRRDGDLYVTDLAGARTVALTTGGATDTLSHDRAAWSPDGRRVVYVRSDAGRVPVRYMLEPTDPTYPRLREIRYARVGTPIPELRVGVVSAEGGDTRWLELPASPGGFYLGWVDWTPDGREVVVEQRSRGRDHRAFLRVDPETGAVTTMYQETDSAWATASYQTNGGLAWIRDGGAWVLVSERDGWRHAWVVGRDGGEPTPITPGDFDLIARGPVVDGWQYYDASPDDATQRYLYRVPLDGSGPPERLTPAGRPGTHEYDIAPGGRWALHTYSTFETPPVTELVSLPDHRTVRVLEDNAALAARVEPVVGGHTEFLKLDIGDGVVMDAWMIRPRDFDPSRRYPLFVYVYGEPHAQTVLDRWSGNQIYHQIIADLGYVVVSIDNRGTPAPKGAAWRRAIFPSLGPLSTEEQAAGVKALGRDRSYVDLSRVGVWGWSGGGSNTLNALFRRPDVFHVGIAVAPKPQPRLYNAWFQEIYMRTPEENPEGYRLSAPLNYAEGLEGDLLIVHGTGETNTHLEITEGLVDRLIGLGKTFRYMTYPNRNHGISAGEGTSLHLRMLMVGYLLEHLPAGGR